MKVNIEEADYPLQRDNDKYIMELAEDLGFRSCELRFLNHCRLFLNVISLSDIVNESGRGIDPTVTNFKKLPGKQLSDVCIQHKPDHTKWSIWFRFINLITNARQHTLKQPLGAWCVNQDQIRKKFSSYRTSNMLFKAQEGTIYAKNIHKVAGTEWVGFSQETVETIPVDATPCLQSYAGWLYTQYNKKEDMHQDKCLPAAKSGIISHIRQKRINGNSARFMRKVIQTELIEEHYQQKLGDVYNKVQWEVFQKALKQKKAKGALLKMLHGICPTKKHLTKIRLTIHPECPCCKQDIEDQHHILKCKERSHETYIAFNEEMKKTFSEIKDTENILTQIFDSIVLQSNQMDVVWTFQEQNEIGWDKLLTGFVSQDWQKVMNKLVPDKRWTETMGKIVAGVWRTWLAMWRLRNSSLDTNTRYCAQMIDDNNRLSLHIIYSLRKMLSRSVQQTMKRTVMEHLQMTREEVSNWLLMYTEVIKNSIDKQDSEIWQRTRDEWITKFSSEE